MMGKKKGPLRAALERATELYQSGAVDEYLAVLLEARKRAPSDGKGLPTEELAALAEGWEAQAFDELYKGRLQRGLECLVEAERLLEGRPELDELRGRICFRIGSQISGHTPELRSLTEEYTAKARALLAGSAEYRELLDSIPIDPGDTEESWQVRRGRLLDEVRLLRTQIRKDPHGVPSEAIKRMLDVRLKAIYIGIEEGDDKAAEESFIDAADMLVTVLDDDSGPFFGIAQVLSHVLDRPGMKLGDPLRQAAEVARSLAVASGSADHLSEAYFLAALRDREIPDLESCLRHIIASVWHGQRYQVEDSPSALLREATKHRLDEKRALAIDVALELGYPELVAELIESARLQALAESAKAQFDSAQNYDLARLLTATGTPLQDVHPVSVGGRSRVAEASKNGVAPKALPLEPAIAALGGSRAVFWGSWVALRKCYWAIRAPHGAWSAGVLDLGPYESTVLAAAEDLRPDGSYSTLKMLEDPEKESFLTRQLGRMVIPSPLADMLKAAPVPVSLVVAGGFVCQLPLPALVIPGTSDERLIERALIRVQPPLILIKATSSQPCAVHDDDSLIVRLACLDPAGDLPHSRNYDIPSEMLLTAPSKISWAQKHEKKKEPAWSRLASRGNLAEYLGRMEPGEPAAFVYSGHVQQNGVADGPETSLVLADGLFSAAELSGLPIPSHVLLSACSSSGAGGAGAGEWLGLAGSLLRGGARYVIATSWPIPDAEFTAHFELEIIKQMCATGDAATALRKSQLDALTEWRSGTWRASKAPFPRIWAAFQVIGLLCSPGSHSRRAPQMDDKDKIDDRRQY